MDNLIFKSHDAGIGDCFSIEISKMIFLVDGGNKKSIVNDFKGKNINVCIVTHNDRDHTYGISKILKCDPEIEIKELWLPGFWQPILEFIKNKPETLLNLENYSVNIGTDILTEKCPELIDYDSLEDISTHFFAIDDEKLQFAEIYKFFKNWKKYNPKKALKPSVFDVDRILQIFTLGLERGCIIRFFYPENIITNFQLIGYPFKMLNSKEMLNFKTPRNTAEFMQLLYLSNNNKYSLVFEFIEKEKPIVLFTADSDLSFIDISEPLNYNNESIIVTVPHHGSKTNSSAYSKIIATNSIWVKSGGSMKSLPSDDFKNLDVYKICNKCPGKFNYRNITLNFKKITWNFDVCNNIICCGCDKSNKKKISERPKKIKNIMKK